MLSSSACTRTTTSTRSLLSMSVIVQLHRSSAFLFPWRSYLSLLSRGGTGTAASGFIVGLDRSRGGPPPPSQARRAPARLKNARPERNGRPTSPLKRARRRRPFMWKQCAVCHGETGAGNGTGAAPSGPGSDELPGGPADSGLRRGGARQRRSGHGDAEMGTKAHTRRAIAVGPLRADVLREGNRGVTVMAVNVIVVAVTLMMGGFVVVWLAYPRCRRWFEAPKWQPLRWDKPPNVPRDWSR